MGVDNAVVDVDCLKINNKKVYIVDSHQQVMLPWSQYRKNNKAPILFTLDYHADLHEPFQRFTSDYGVVNMKRRFSLISKVNYKDELSVIETIKSLEYDEHIKTAIASDIIRLSCVVCFMYEDYNIPQSDEELSNLDVNCKNCMIDALYYLEGEDNEASRHVDMPQLCRPFHYSSYEKSMNDYRGKIYIPQWKYLNVRNGKSFEDSPNCFRDYVIEDWFLKDILSYFSEMGLKYISEEGIKDDYILDIDLDYFTTVKSLNPDNVGVFYRLIKDAKIITIAKELKCVKSCSKGVLDGNDSLERILWHIEMALK